MTSRTARLTELLRTLLFAQRAAGEQWVRQSGLTRSQAFTLGYVDENQDRGVIARELAEMSGTTPASVTSLLQGLEERGYITRSASPSDSRVKLIRTTAEGSRVIAGFDEAMTAAQEGLFAALDEADQDALLALLERVAAGVADRAADGTSPPESGRGRR